MWYSRTRIGDITLLECHTVGQKMLCLPFNRKWGTHLILLVTAKNLDIQCYVCPLTGIVGSFILLRASKNLLIKFYAFPLIDSGDSLILLVAAKNLDIQCYVCPLRGTEDCLILYWHIQKSWRKKNNIGYHICIRGRFNVKSQKYTATVKLRGCVIKISWIAFSI